MKVNLGNLSQEELIKMINKKDKKIEVLIEKLNIFKYENTRGHEYAKSHLEGYHHILQSDEYQACEELEGITHMGC